MPEGTAPHPGPEGRDIAGLDELRDRAACLVAAAPDRRRAAQAAGDLDAARQQWERSAGLAQQAGWLPLVLAQQALLAELAAARGDTAGARMLAREVGRWATSLGLARLRSQAGAISPGL